MKLILVLILVNLCCFVMTLTQNDAEIEKLCSLNDQCSNCLEAHSACSWCTDRDYVTFRRCSTKFRHTETGNCSLENIIENIANTEVLENLDVQDYVLDGSKTRVVQLQPQKIQLKIFKSNPQRFKITYRPAANYPLDLYVLMDLSWSMRDDRETLLKLGEELTETLRDLTENYRLGFGSYADKPTFPMSSPNTKLNPCKFQEEGATCEPTYGFRHHLAMSKDVQKFIQQVNNSQVTANLDNLEGGFEALMQVIVCTDQIGWIPGARKVVLLVSDGFMHFAGDGKLAGATKINDKKCHLTESGEYTGSLIYDYPSLEQIYRELTKQKVNVIFAVTEEVASSYREIVNLMTEISGVEILTADSSNILQLIKQGHERLIHKVHFEAIGVPSTVSVNYETSCGGQFKELKTINNCENVEEGKEIDLFVTITMNDYPKDEIYNHKIRLEASGLSEFIEVDLELQRPCPCTENRSISNTDDELCNQHGYFHCGMCVCAEGWLGTSCVCDVTGNDTSRALEYDCRPRLSSVSEEYGEICSGAGECDCGKCLCAEGYTGRFCECKECNQCDPERQICECGICVCAYGWFGGECNCRNDACISPNDGKICSSRGHCNCGQCECEEPYRGKFCEMDSSEHGTNMLCEYYEPCISCLISRRLKSSTSDCNENMERICSGNENKTFVFEFVDKIEAGNTTCVIRVESLKTGIKSDYTFSYHIDSTKTSYLEISLVEEVHQMAMYAGIGFGVTLLLGLLTIFAYKMHIDNLNKREFEKVNAESLLTMNSGTAAQGNPIYKNPVSSYMVPEAEESL